MRIQIQKGTRWSCTTDTVFAEHKEVDMESDSSLLLCLGHAGQMSYPDHTDTAFKSFCLFPEIKGKYTHSLQTKDKQMSIAQY